MFTSVYGGVLGMKNILDVLKGKRSTTTYFIDESSLNFFIFLLDPSVSDLKQYRGCSWRFQIHNRIVDIKSLVRLTKKRVKPVRHIGGFIVFITS